MAAGRGGSVTGWLKALIGDSPAAPVALPELVLPTGEGPVIWLRVGAGYPGGEAAGRCLRC